MSDDKIIRIVRVLEYVGPKDAIYKDLEKRYIKGSADFPVCAGKGTLREISLEEVEFLSEAEEEADQDYHMSNEALNRCETETIKKALR